MTVDDEAPARAKIARLLRSDGRFELVAECASVRAAADAVGATRPHVVFLDIEMPGANGFELLRESPDFAVVLSTAYAEHAVRAFESDAVDYLLKPYDAVRFRRALDRVVRRLEGASARVVLRSADGEWLSLFEHEIVQVVAANKHVSVVTHRGSFLVREPLQRVEADLGVERFARVHRGTVVRIDAVRRVTPGAHGDASLLLEDGTETLLTRKYRRSFLSRYRGDEPDAG
jgi:two-component system LytT family response regulator